jgi:hypothetical protein
MTSDQQTERALRAVFAEDMEVLPDRILDAVLADLPVTPQLRRARGRWRIPVGTARFAIVAAIVAVALVASIGLLTRQGGVGGEVVVPPPSATPTASPTPADTGSPAPSVAPGYATTPPNWPTPAPLAPSSPLPAPAGSPLPADLVGRVYNTDPLETQGIQALLLTLRAADDPHCTALYGGRSTCFTILWTPNYPKHASDPAVRGWARIVDGNLVLGFALVPNDEPCQGTSSTYSVSPDGWTLRAIDAPACSFRGFVRH